MKRIALLNNRRFWLFAFSGIPIPFLIAGFALRSPDVTEAQAFLREKQREFRTARPPVRVPQLPMMTAKDFSELIQPLAHNWYGTANPTAPEFAPVLDKLNQFAPSARELAAYVSKAAENNTILSLQGNGTSTLPMDVSNQPVTVLSMTTLQDAAEGNWEKASTDVGLLSGLCHPAYSTGVATSSELQFGINSLYVRTLQSLLLSDPPTTLCLEVASQLKKHRAALQRPAYSDVFVPLSNYDRAEISWIDRAIANSAVVDFTLGHMQNERDPWNFAHGNSIPWTGTRDRVARIRQIVRQHPDYVAETFTRAWMPFEPKGSSAVKAILAYGRAAEPLTVARARRLALNRVIVLEAAYHAKAVFMQSGEWPLIDELLTEIPRGVPSLWGPDQQAGMAYPMGFPTELNLTDQPYGFLTAGYVDLTTGVLSVLLPQNFANSFQLGESNGEMRLVKVRTDQRLPGISLSSLKEHLTRNLGADNTSISLVEEAREGERVSSLLGMEAKLRPASGLEPPMLRLVGEFLLPKRVYAIWMKGPDALPEWARSYRTLVVPGIRDKK